MASWPRVDFGRVVESSTVWLFSYSTGVWQALCWVGLSVASADSRKSRKSEHMLEVEPSVADAHGQSMFSAAQLPWFSFFLLGTWH